MVTVTQNACLLTEAVACQNAVTMVHPNRRPLALPDNRSLRFSSVTLKTHLRYQTQVRRFVEFAEWAAIAFSPLPGPNHLDDIAVRFIELLANDGGSLGHASDLLSGIQHFLPAARRHLPGAWRTFAAWKCKWSRSQAPPLGAVLCEFIIRSAWAAGQRRFAAALALAFGAFLRPSEIIGLTPLALAIFEEGQVPKILFNLGLCKISIRFGWSDSTDAIWPLAVRAGRWAKTCPALVPSAPIYLGNYREFTDLLAAWIAVAYDLSDPPAIPEPYSLYSIRRGGATHDYLVGGDVSQTQFRGRWAHHSTMRTYVQSARAAAVDIRVPPTVAAASHILRGLDAALFL